MSGSVLAEPEDDDGFLASLQRDDALVAELLICLSRSKAYPRRQFLEPTEGPPLPPVDTEKAVSLQRLLSPGLKWVRQGIRSRCITMEGILAAKRKEDRRTSPTTPLSWSGGSGTSGSVCEGIPPTPPLKRRKLSGVDEHRGSEPGQQQAAEVCHEGKQIRAPPAKRRKSEPQQNEEPALTPPSQFPQLVTVPEGGMARGDSPLWAPSAVGPSSTVSDSNKAAELPAVPKEPPSSRPAAQVEPLRLRLTAERAISVGAGRPGKKKTLAELQATRDSLLQEQEGLRKELGRQREAYDALLNENLRLKELESSLSSDMASRSTSTPAVREEPMCEQPQHLPSIPESQTVEGSCTASVTPEEEEKEEEARPEKSQCRDSSSSATGRMVLIDLNCMPDEW